MLAMQRKRSIPSIANNMNEQSFGYLFLDLRDMQDAVGIVNQPAIHSIATRQFLHRKSQQVAATSAVVHDPFARLLPVQASSAECFAPQPDVGHLLAIAPIRRVSGYRKQRVVNKRRVTVDRKSPGIEQAVVEERRS